MTTVLLVMKRSGNIRVMTQVLATIGHEAIGVRDREGLAAELAILNGPCVAVVDASGFGPDDWLLCQALQRHGTRFIVLGGPDGGCSGGEAVRYGAACFLEKPVRKPMLLKLLSSLVGDAMTLQP